ncbi:unnamed protein product [Orchesella dallaii]|uniref:Uncharacterized protein n=1 Tax=Orchesella dallaii TaxID=48710 RepID=A0ABP1PUM3_9HEXA
MEEVPTVLSVLEGADAAGLSADGLTFAITDNEGLSIAYLVQLPAGTVNGHLLTEQLLEQAGLLLETKPNLGENVSNTQLVTENNNDNSTNNNLVGTFAEPVLLSDGTTASSSGTICLASNIDGSTLGLQPIQIQFVQSDSIVEDQKCDLSNFIDMSNNRPPQLTMVTSDNSVNFSIVNSGTSVEEVEQKFTPSSNIDLVSQLSFNEMDKSHHELNGEENSNCILEQPIPPDVPPSILPDNSEPSVSNVDGLHESNVNEPNEPNVDESDESNAIVPDLSDMKFIVNVSKKPVRTYGKPGQTAKITMDVDSNEVTPTSQQSLSGQSLQEPAKLLKVGPITVSQPERIKIESVMGSKPERIKVANKKRRLVVDVNKQIPVTDFRSQLQNTKDITRARGDVAPATKEAMKCLAVGGVARFFSTPGRTIRNVPLSRLFTNHLVMMTERINRPRDYYDLVPLTSDLRVERFPEEGWSGNKDFDDMETDSNTTEKKSTVRLVNIGKPGGASVQSMFKGLHRPPVFKRYKSVKRTSALGSLLVKNKVRRSTTAKETSHDCKTVVKFECEEDATLIETGTDETIGDNKLFSIPNEKSPLSSTNCIDPPNVVDTTGTVEIIVDKKLFTRPTEKSPLSSNNCIDAPSVFGPALLDTQDEKTNVCHLLSAVIYYKFLLPK